MIHSTSPPPYEASSSSTFAPEGNAKHHIDPPSQKVQTAPYAPPMGTPPLPNQPSMPPTTMYHYISPLDQDHITSYLPPDHPQMICLQQGAHIRQTKFGLLGIMAAVIWFPLGVVLCLLDRRVKCQRCGMLLEDGVCG